MTRDAGCQVRPCHRTGQPGGPAHPINSPSLRYSVRYQWQAGIAEIRDQRLVERDWDLGGGGSDRRWAVGLGVSRAPSTADLEARSPTGYP